MCKECAVHVKIKRSEQVIMFVFISALLATIIFCTVGLGGWKGFGSGILLCVPVSFLISFGTLDTSITCISMYNWYCKKCIYNKNRECEPRACRYLEYERCIDSHWDKNKYKF
jgi:hypothetical protein